MSGMVHTRSRRRQASARSTTFLRYPIVAAYTNVRSIVNRPPIG